MTRIFAVNTITALTVFCSSPPAIAQNIPTNLNPTVRVGQTVIIKGVRGSECGQAAGAINNMPRSTLGTFSSGSAGTVVSRSCNGLTPARELRFTAKKPGTETITALGDSVTITVTP
jgi:hypothetical protein